MTRTAAALAAAVSAAALAASAAHAQALTPTDFVHRHMAAAAKGDVDAMVADYADDAVTLTAGHATEGKAAIRAMFAKMFGPKPGAAAGAAKPAGGPPPMKTLKIWQEGNVGFVSWQMGAGTPHPVNGVDEFVIKNGKIAVQAVFTGLPQPIQ